MLDTDVAAIGDHILKVGKVFGMTITGVPVFRARRIEAGLLTTGTDFDDKTTPFEVGLGHMVEILLAEKHWKRPNEHVGHGACGLPMG